MISKIFLTAITVFIFLAPVAAQEDIQIGSLKYDQRYQSGFFDFSDPTGINIKVQLWGYVKYPGYYIIPARSSANDLISLAGGPTQDALMEDIRILRTNLDSSNTIYRYNYNDLLWGDEFNEPIKFPRLYAGDMIIVPGEPRYFVRQDISFYLSITTALASTAALILSIIK
ncbi:MAG: hypothetical protein A2W11_14405 [Ignavibacteria bacterium RBG_16_35_7]|nr:MAG: hypothetical protein A2W11_14405 [Ignavibacteria bacterium RBG_16_35_7]